MGLWSNTVRRQAPARRSGASPAGPLRPRLQALLLLATGVVGWAGAVAAGPLSELDRDHPVEITADEITYDAPREVYVAEGAVRVLQEERHIEAEWVVFNRRTLRGIAAGAVVIVDGEQVLEAGFVEFDYQGQRGVMFDGRLDLGPDELMIGAGELRKTGDDTYSGADVSFTACRCPDPESRLPWQLDAQDADVEIGGYLTAKNATLDILGIPTVWLPWSFFPVKTERESGFLMPEIGYGGHNGFEAALPFFWAALDEVNVILTPRYLTLRGFKPEVEIETVYGTRSETELYGTFIRDKDPDRSFRLGQDPAEGQKDVYGRDRWGAKFDNDVFLPGEVRARSDIQVVSDNEFVRDFDDFQSFRRDRFLTSEAFAFRHFGAAESLAATAELVYRDDRQNPDFDDRDHFLLQRAPGVALDLLPTSVAGERGPDFEMGVDYVHFWPYQRAEDALDLSSDQIVGDDLFGDIGIAAIPDLAEAIENDPSLSDERKQEVLRKLGVGNGRFDEGEPEDDEGHRVVLYPRIGRSFRLFDALYVRPEVGWQQTLYSTRGQSFAERGLLTARLDATTQLTGRIAPPFLGPAIHLLEPRLGWALVQRRGQSGNPLFIPATRVPQRRIRQLSLDNVVLDDADRIGSANVLTLGLGNRFYAETPDRPLLADVTLQAGYDFAGRSAGHPEELVLDGRTFATTGIPTHFIAAWDLDRSRIEEGLFEAGIPLGSPVSWIRDPIVTLSYRYRREIPLFYEFFPSVQSFNDFEAGFEHLNQVTARARMNLFEQWGVGWNLIYSIEKDLLQTNGGFVEYTSTCRCWAIRLDMEDDRSRGFQATVRFAVLGLGADPDHPFQGSRGLGTRSLY